MRSVTVGGSGATRVNVSVDVSIPSVAPGTHGRSVGTGFEHLGADRLGLGVEVREVERVARRELEAARVVGQCDAEPDVGPAAAVLAIEVNLEVLDRAVGVRDRAGERQVVRAGPAGVLA